MIDRNSSSEVSDAILVSIYELNFYANFSKDIEVTKKVKNNEKTACVFEEETSGKYFK